MTSEQIYEQKSCCSLHALLSLFSGCLFLGLSHHLSLGYMAQETFDDAQPCLPFPPVLPMIGTCAQSIVPSQAGNSALDACTPPIASLPSTGMFHCLPYD